MATLLQFARLLAIVIWVGGIIFFAFVLAPAAFGILPSQHSAGMVVGGALRVLDIIGLVCGAVFFLLTALLFRRSSRTGAERYQREILLASIMLCATAYIHAGIIPAMEQDRLAVGGAIETAPAANPAKVHFETLHKRSEQVEGTVLLCGLAIVLLLASESIPSSQYT